MIRNRHRGQVLVLFAGGLIGFVALAALVIDLSSVYSLQQMEKSATDAAALAGAQDLQVAGSRAIGNRTTARTNALANLAGQFNVAVPTALACATSSDITDCPLAGTPYHIAISTPSKTTGDPRSLQASLWNPSYQLSFSHLLGQSGWNVGKTSVAVIGYSARYSVVTLQPPDIKPNNTDANLCNDLNVNGTGTILNVLRGDIGTNTSANTTNSGIIQLATGYRIDHIDDLAFGGCQYTTPGASWQQVSGEPVGNHIGPTPLLTDPAFPMAAFTNSPAPYANPAAGATACVGAPGYPTDSATLTQLATAATGGTITCYKPGIYSSFTDNSNKNVSYLLPGAYRFDGGVNIGGTLAGGMIDSSAGVVLVVPQTQTLATGNALLNAGSASCASDSCRATPATDFAATPSLIATPSGLTITVEVPRDANCYSGNIPIISASCNVNQNKTVKLAGNAFFEVAGVIYGPSDNMTINSSVQNGLVGAIYSWSVKYAGGATLNQELGQVTGGGVLRLDAACSGPNTPCSP